MRWKFSWTDRLLFLLSIKRCWTVVLTLVPIALTCNGSNDPTETDNAPGCCLFLYTNTNLVTRKRETARITLCELNNWKYNVDVYFRYPAFMLLERVTSSSFSRPGVRSHCSHWLFKLHRDCYLWAWNFDIRKWIKTHTHTHTHTQ
jgi:hypothetical protein